VVRRQHGLRYDDEVEAEARTPAEVIRRVGKMGSPCRGLRSPTGCVAAENKASSALTDIHFSAGKPAFLPLR
jgi:hypothetical protein